MNRKSSPELCGGKVEENQQISHICHWREKRKLTWWKELVNVNKRQNRGHRDICWCHLQDALRIKNCCTRTGKQLHCKVSTKASNSLTFFSWTASFSGNESWKGKERCWSGVIHSRQKEVLNTPGEKIFFWVMQSLTSALGSTFYVHKTRSPLAASSKWPWAGHSAQSLFVLQEQEVHWGLTLCNPHQLQHNNPLTSLPLSSHLLLSDSGFHFSPQHGTMPDSLIEHSPRHDCHHPHQNSNSAQAAKSGLVCHQVRHPRGRISLGGFNDNQSKHAAAAFSFKTNTDFRSSGVPQTNLHLLGIY